MKWLQNSLPMIMTFIVAWVAFRWVDRLFPTLTTPPAAVQKIF